MVELVRVAGLAAVARARGLDRRAVRRQLVDAHVAPAAAWGATVRGTYGTPEAGTRTQYVQYAGPWGQAALRPRYVPNAGGWYA